MTTTPTKNESLPELGRPDLITQRGRTGYSQDRVLAYGRACYEAALTREAPTEGVGGVRREEGWCDGCPTHAELRRLLERERRITKQLVAEDDARFALEQTATPPAPQRMAQGEDKRESAFVAAAMSGTCDACGESWCEEDCPARLGTYKVRASLADRLRPNVEATPWVISVVRELERDYNRLLNTTPPASPEEEWKEYERKYATPERLAKPSATEKCDFCGVRQGELHAFDCTALDEPTQPPHHDRGEEVTEPGAIRALVTAANAVLALHPEDDGMWTLELAVRPFNAAKPAECANGCPANTVCDYCQVATNGQPGEGDEIDALRAELARIEEHGTPWVPELLEWLEKHNCCPTLPFTDYELIEALEARFGDATPPAPQRQSSNPSGLSSESDPLSSEQRHPDALEDGSLSKSTAKRVEALAAASVGRMTMTEYTTGHCPNHNQPGGCQLHNLQCGWPNCDRRQVQHQPAAAASVSERAREIVDFINGRCTNEEAGRKCLGFFVQHGEKLIEALRAIEQALTQQPTASAEHWHGLYRKECRLRQDDAARYGQQIVDLESALTQQRGEAAAWLIRDERGRVVDAVESEAQRDRLLNTGYGQLPQWTAEPLYAGSAPLASACTSWTHEDLKDLRERLVSAGISAHLNGDSNKASDRQFIRQAVTEAYGLIDDLLTTTPQPSADAVRELVRKWRGIAETNFAQDRLDKAIEISMDNTLRDCADELESLLSGGSHA